MPDGPDAPRSAARSQLGLYRSWLTSPEHRLHITVGRSAMLGDTVETLRKNLGRKPKHHQLFIAPRGSGKTHFLSLIEDEIRRDPALNTGYLVARFPEEANRVLSFASFLLTVCEILEQNTPSDAPWRALHSRFATEDNDTLVADTLVKAFRDHHRQTGRILVVMVENLNQLMEEHIKSIRSIQALRGFLMGDNGCLLIATAPIHFGAVTKPDQPFYDFFDTQVLELLTADDTIELIRRNLEWDKRDDLLARFPELMPKLRAIHTLTGGSPRLTVMLYELLATESITAVKEQFMALQDRITPFYQDRMRDLSPQERAVLETIATMRDQPGQPAARKTPSNIAKLMRMGQQQVSVLLNRLAKSLYLTSADNPADKRSTLFTIREGFFDLWLVMNLSRAARQRIPLLADFFASFYEQDAQRRLKREEYWQRLRAGEFNEDAAESLSYLSEVGTPEEKAAEKMKLITRLEKAGDRERPAMLRSELRALSLDSTGCWIREHLDTSQEDNHLDAIQEIIRCWETQRDGGLEAFAQQLREMGLGLNHRGWSATRIKFLQDNLDQLPTGAARIETRLQLARMFRKYARWQDADALGVVALDEAEAFKEVDLIVRALDSQAQLFHDMNRLAEAEPMLRRALAVNEAARGVNHPSMTIHLNNLGLLLKDTNRLAEAELMVRRALAIDEAAYGANNPTVSVDLNNLAQLLQETNRLEEAESMMRRALAIDDAAYGADHPAMGVRLNNLAVLLLRMNRLEEAELMLRRAIAIDEAFYGAEHSSVSAALNNLAQLLQRANRHAEAEPMMKRAMEIDEAVYGTNHPTVALRFNNLATLLRKTNRSVEAEPLMERAVGIFFRSQRDNGYSHYQQAAAVRNYGILLDELGMSDSEVQAKITALAASYGLSLSD